MNRFENRIALVTGAGSGIGRATAQRLASEGATVFVADVDAGAIEGVVSGIREEGGTAVATQLDVADEAAWETTLDEVRTQLGELHLLVNVAGITGAPSDVTAEELSNWERVIGINQTGTLLGLKHAVPLMQGSTGSRAIVNTSSVSGLVGQSGTNPAYAASKGAVRALTKNTAVRLAPMGIRVNSVYPGVTETAIFATADPAVLESLSTAIPMGRVGQPSELAAAIAFLLSEDASYITAAELVVDGGLIAP
jgi:NAD(P)-dependent dehydrogenase (short-subunit alcohol dehydrogenase family)